MNQKKIIVIQPLPGIGDTIWFLPHVHLLGQRGDLTLLTKKNSQAASLLSHDPSIKDIQYIFRNSGIHDGILGFFRLAWQIRQGNFDEAWILHKSPRYAYAAKMAGIGKIYSYGSGYSHLFNVGHTKFSSSQLTLHPIEQGKLLLFLHGYPSSQFPSYHLYHSPEAQKNINLKLKPFSKPYMIFGIGGSESSKKWPLARWAALAEAVCQTFRGHIFLLGGPAETSEAQTIYTLLSAEAKKHVTYFTNLPLEESMALTQQGNIFIGNDTGMLNIAAACGIPTFGIFHENLILSYTPNLKAVYPTDRSQNPFKNIDIIVNDVVRDISPYVNT